MKKIYVTAIMPDKVIDKIEEYIRKENIDAYIKMYTGVDLISKDVLKKEIKDTDYLICTLSTNIDNEILKSAKQLKLIANFGAGYNNINILEARKNNIDVTNTPVGSSISVAEVTLGLYLAMYHRILEGDAVVRAGEFSGWAPTYFLGHELENKVLGIVGLGKIGKEVARRAKSFGLKIIYTQRRKVSSEIEDQLDIEYVSFEQLLVKSDIISLHVPLTPESKHMFSTTQFEMMKRTSIIVNMSRGPLIDEQSLIKALKEDQIFGAALDVYEFEPNVSEKLIRLSNTILTPHIGNATFEARDAMGEVIVNNIIKSLENRPVNYVVN